MATMKQMCEHIEKARILKDKDGNMPMAEEIFNYSATGELFMIFDWYDSASQHLGYYADGKEYPTGTYMKTIDKEGNIIRTKIEE